MSEYEEEVAKAEKELEQSLVQINNSNAQEADDEFLGELKMQAQEYGQKLQDAADKAKVFANEKFSQAGDKFNELKNKDPKELVDDAKEFAREKPGQALLISAAVGLVIGLIFGRRR
ncbi:MAG: YqjD family protein [Pyrinomonadaceae bacterium]